MRKKILNAFLMVGFAMLVLTFAFQQFAPRQELTLVKGMGLGIISMAALLITVILSINLIPTEIERRTIYTILSKPVRRHEFLLGKYFGAASTIFVNVGLMGIAFVFAIILKQRGLDVGALNMLKGVWMIYCQMALLSAVAIFFSTFLSPLVNFFLTFSLFIIGNLSSFTMDLAKNTQNVLAKGFFTIVHYVVPNFGNFNYTNPLVQVNVQVKSEAALLTQNTIYAVVYATVLLILSILVFDRREV
ncbi:ABC-type transport system involved in multi-copper enzyme maturation permease subunit [Armatimonas rosea]|uniref:ABC-type transport system involved in multi-copper enzyme maturation permease subunit n=2 Tax=Armatimonas rosea TaxID=685828 RepID=A0A7W9W973_ARMRO|nr:ABC transporter permease [Armatimonas rosea]MBB6053553.1 ABC-type transport system involved in multi-copper enzyme maturation permease subunit [Armatimonas rosea]